MIELLATAPRNTVFSSARPIADICMGKYLLFIAGSCVRHVHRAGKLQKFEVKTDVMYTNQRAVKLGSIHVPSMADSCEESDEPSGYVEAENLALSSIIKRGWKTEHEMGRQD